eukprot:GHVT01009324.1.p1 GENE.GHVT01009324.1~~GHVT01009324.1.p1  ORF type:complete len:1010 (+),score=181.61 GHVT01009324.1:1265-4294(+)
MATIQARAELGTDDDESSTRPFFAASTLWWNGASHVGPPPGRGAVAGLAGRGRLASPVQSGNNGYLESRSGGPICYGGRVNEYVDGTTYREGWEEKTGRICSQWREVATPITPNNGDNIPLASLLVLLDGNFYLAKLYSRNLSPDIRWNRRAFRRLRVALTTNYDEATRLKLTAAVDESFRHSFTPPRTDASRSLSGGTSEGIKDPRPARSFHTPPLSSVTTPAATHTKTAAPAFISRPLTFSPKTCTPNVDMPFEKDERAATPIVDYSAQLFKGPLPSATLSLASRKQLNPMMLEVWLIAVAGLDGLQDFPKGGPSASGPAVRLASGISLVAEPVENLPTEKLFAAACKLQSAYETSSKVFLAESKQSRTFLEACARDLQVAVSSKEELQKDYVDRFVLLLNSKKSKLRVLRSEVAALKQKLALSQEAQTAPSLSSQLDAPTHADQPECKSSVLSPCPSSLGAAWSSALAAVFSSPSKASETRGAKSPLQFRSACGRTRSRGGRRAAACPATPRRVSALARNSLLTPPLAGDPRLSLNASSGYQPSCLPSEKYSVETVHKRNATSSACYSSTSPLASHQALAPNRQASQLLNQRHTNYCHTPSPTSVDLRSEDPPMTCSANPTATTATPAAHTAAASAAVTAATTGATSEATATAAAATTSGTSSGGALVCALASSAGHSLVCASGEKFAAGPSASAECASPDSFDFWPDYSDSLSPSWTGAASSASFPSEVAAVEFGLPGAAPVGSSPSLPPLASPVVYRWSSRAAPATGIDGPLPHEGAPSLSPCSVVGSTTPRVLSASSYPGVSLGVCSDSNLLKPPLSAHSSTTRLAGVFDGNILEEFLGPAPTATHCAFSKPANGVDGDCGAVHGPPQERRGTPVSFAAKMRRLNTPPREIRGGGVTPDKNQEAVHTPWVSRHARTPASRVSSSGHPEPSLPDGAAAEFQPLRLLPRTCVVPLGPEPELFGAAPQCKYTSASYALEPATPPPRISRATSFDPLMPPEDEEECY